VKHSQNQGGKYPRLPPLRTPMQLKQMIKNTTNSCRRVNLVWNLGWSWIRVWKLGV